MLIVSLSRVRLFKKRNVLHLMMRIQFWRSGDYRVILHYHYSEFHSVVVPAKAPSIVEINLFENYLYSIGQCDQTLEKQ